MADSLQLFPVAGYDLRKVKPQSFNGIELCDRIPAQDIAPGITKVEISVGAVIIHINATIDAITQGFGICVTGGAFPCLPAACMWLGRCHVDASLPGFTAIFHVRRGAPDLIFSQYLPIGTDHCCDLLASCNQRADTAFPVNT